MKKICWLSRLSRKRFSPAAGRIAWLPGVAILLTGIAVAQAPAPDNQPVTAPKGYTVHEAIDLGGHITGVTGSGAMYDTLVNEDSGPRVLGETFEMHALPGAKNTLFDNLTAFGSGFGGDPYNFAKMDFYKGRLYDFSGMFRRDRQYFDYDLLGNPNIPSGQSLAVSGGSPYAWSQLGDSPFLFNTVRRMTDTNATILPLSKVTFRVAYSQDIFQGPSLTPSGYQFAGGRTSELLREFQRNSTDSFRGGIDWKPLPKTRLTFEEIVDHYKADSWFTMAPGYQTVQEPDGTVVTLLSGYDSLTPSITCNSGATPALSAPQTAGGLPVVNPGCAVISSYLRTQPTRILYPTEIFRFQSSSIRNITMNGDVRYTDANMSLPSYYENFQGLTGTTRALTYTATASAKRKVTAVDYGIVWQPTQKVSFSDQVTFSNEQQPGTSSLTGDTASSAAAATINSGTLTTKSAAAGTEPIEGTAGLGDSQPAFFGQKFVTNDLTGTWDGWSRATVSLTYRHRYHRIAQGQGYVAHDAPLAVAETTTGTVTINQDGGILNIALRPTSKWDLNGSAEVMGADNVFTPIAPRELQHYRIHTLYRAKSWATISGSYNDLERHDNTNNNQSAVALYASSAGASGDPYEGPIAHVDHTRTVSMGAQIFPNEHYGLDFNYDYSDVYTSTNICYAGGATAALPVAAAPPNGAGCPGVLAGHGTLTPTSVLDFGPVKDFMDAPTQSGSVDIHLSPNTKLSSNIGYRINSVSGSRFYNDPRDVAGSLVSTYQSPFVNVAWAIHPGFIWKAEYNFYGYGEGGPSGAPYCTTSTTLPSQAGGSAPVVSCASTGQQTGLTISPAGETAPRNFHANNVTLGFHYEF